MTLKWSYIEVIITSLTFFVVISLVVTPGHLWSLVVTRCQSWSLVYTRGHSCTSTFWPYRVEQHRKKNWVLVVISQDSLSSVSPITHDGQIWVFFLPLTSQRRLQSSDGNEIWREYSLRNSPFNGSSLTSLTETVTSHLTLISDTKM